MFHSMLTHPVEELKIDEVKGGITHIKLIIKSVLRFISSNVLTKIQL